MKYGWKAMKLDESPSLKIYKSLMIKLIKKNIR
jgi:hypothetical protein